ncbi:MAG TPA: S8 family serine peptidase [Caulobacter sp.]|nr:S8 family serine peptidase [Caulobacter sp.]
MQFSNDPGGRRGAMIALVLVLLAAAPAAAQLPGGGLPDLPGTGGGLPNLPAGGGLPQTPGALPGEVGGRLGRGLDAADPVGRVSELTTQRVEQLRELVRRNPRELDVDDRGSPVVRAQILAVEPTPRSLAIAEGLGFRLLRRESEGIEVVVLSPPAGLDVRRALKRLRKADPAGDYDYNHLYSGAGEAAGAARPGPVLAGAGFQASGAGLRIGLVDTGVDPRHPALAGARIEQRPFAPGGLRPAAHGTAAASLLAGRDGGFRGAAAGAQVLVADVYGTGPTGGSADAVARALGWLGAAGVPVINISLVGPQNAVVRAMVRRLSARGVILVAAVGNDGPAAQPLYPAAWPEVVAVTGVDRRDRVLPEACRGPHLDFAAPGSDMAAGRPGGGYATVRGTSFAAPLVAGRLAILRRQLTPEQAIAALGREARDLGQKGPDKVYGRGLVAADLRMAPPAARK